MNYKERFLKDITEKFMIQIDEHIIQDYYWQVLEEKDKEIERLNNIIKKAIEFIYENAYDEERENCIDDLWGEIPKLVEILKGSDENE